MQHSNVLLINIEQEIKTSFLDYSMSVIVSRALPDVRDGLKPVHRRILYAMYTLKNFHNRPYLKSARIVGDVIGKYHPHGDSAVYDALVRMAQNFSLRYPLIDGQGNFGSIDGDSAAAMRYTESRLQALTEYLLEDLDKDTVDFVPNYDNKDEEPVILPASFPQLLVNGSSGIAVGMATNIPPHNMGEVLSALEALIKDPSLKNLDLMAYIKGPDFPTRAEIHGVSGIREAYETGRGSVIMRAKAKVEDASTGRERIIVSELPFQVNKSKLIEKIAELVNEKKIEGISDIRDESAKEEIRIVIDLKRGEASEIVLNNLYKLTQMQSSFGINLLALVKGVPKVLGIKEILFEFYQHRREVILRKTSFQLAKCEERAHLLLGLKIAIENADDVIAIIRNSVDSAEASLLLISKYGLTELQAKAILDMRLARLTSMERGKVVSEHEGLMVEIARLKDILLKSDLVTEIILNEITLLKEKYISDERRTIIITSDADYFTMEKLVADEEVAVTVTHAGYVKRTALAEIISQRRGGKGKSGMLTKEDDFVENVFSTSNHQSLLCFTNKGKVYNLKVYQVPEAPLRAKGKHFANLIQLEENERVVSVLPVQEFKPDCFIFSVTKNGYVKKTDLMAYSSVRSSGIIGLKLEEGDSLIQCLIGGLGDEVIIASKMGKAIRFKEDDVRATGRVSMGVTGIRFNEESDSAIGAEIIKLGTKSSILSVCENGYGKRTPLEEYRVQSRGGKGIFTIRVTERNGPVISICQVNEEDEIMVMSSSGKLSRMEVKEIGIVGRVTQGVRLMSLSEDEKIIAISKVSPAMATVQEEA